MTSGPEVVLDVERRSGAFLLILANTGSSTAFEPRVRFEPAVKGLGGTVDLSELPIWSGLPMLRPGASIEVLLDTMAIPTAETRFVATVGFTDGTGTKFERAYRHDLHVYDDLPSLAD